ncbi:MAG TPA: MFS transporter [Actinomycetota bacterium]|nr:MFS transporter [Actinomycetota bacterium]
MGKGSPLERAQAEQALLEPSLPHGGALPPALLANRPFLWLVASHGVASLGYWGFFVAVLGEATYGLQARPFQLALLFSAFSLAFLLLAPLLGMATDRWSPKWLLAAGMAASGAGMAVALLGDSLPLLYLATALDGAGAAASIPARGALTALLVERGDLVRANGALNTASMLAVILGPGASGLVARAGGQDAAYLSVMGALALGLVLLLPLADRRPRRGEGGSFPTDLVLGFRVAAREPELRTLLVLAAAAWLTLTVLVALEPVYVKEVLGRGVDGLGFLWSAHGVGAFLGALALTRSRRAAGREVPLIGASLLLGGVGFLAYVASGVFEVGVVGTAALGVGFARYLSLSQALIQRVAGEDLRGRVTGAVGMLQEASGLVCALTVAALGGLVVVQPFLVGAAVAFTLAGLYGLRAGRRLAARSGACAGGGGSRG